MHHLMQCHIQMNYEDNNSNITNDNCNIKQGMAAEKHRTSK